MFYSYFTHIHQQPHIAIPTIPTNPTIAQPNVKKKSVYCL